jgi:hypothetical protein
VGVAKKTANHVGSHPTETDHCELHIVIFDLESACSGIIREKQSDSSADIAVKAVAWRDRDTKKLAWNLVA